MSVPDPKTVADVKIRLGERFASVEYEPGKQIFVPVDDDNVPYEPAQASQLPMVSIMTAGFDRAGLETPEVSGPRIRDPLGGRIWVFHYAVRLWVEFINDEAAAQRQMDDLLTKVVLAFEVNKSLGGIATDSAMSHGDVGIVRPSSGNPLLMLTCDTAVEIETNYKQD